MESFSPESNIDINALTSGNEIDIQSTLHRIKESGDLAYLIQVINLINESKSDSIKKAGIEVARSIKSKENKAIILPLILNDQYFNIKKTLIALCWETDMQINEELPIFFNLLSDENYEIVIEAYTVILDNISNITRAECDQFQIQLNDLCNSVEENRKPLIIDCINRLSVFEE